MNRIQSSAILAIIGLFLSLFCTACGGEKTKIEKPKNLLERTVFEKILWEAYMIEGDVRLRIRSENFDSLRLQTTAALNELYKKNNTDHEQFMKSYTYYMNSPGLSSEIMEKIVNQLGELQAKEEAKQKENDSIALANKLNGKDSLLLVNKLIKTIVKVKEK